MTRYRTIREVTSEWSDDVMPAGTLCTPDPHPWHDEDSDLVDVLTDDEAAGTSWCDPRRWAVPREVLEELPRPEKSSRPVQQLELFGGPHA